MPGVRVRCPSERCGAVFEPHERWLGRNMHCPACGTRMTARPVTVDSEISSRTDCVPGGIGRATSPALPFVVLVDNVRSLWNVGSIFRTADACGVRKIVLAGISGCPPRPEISKTALGAEESVAWDYRADGRRALDELAAEGYTAMALESTKRAVSVVDVSWPERVCLVLGNEVAGVAGELLESCPVHVEIPMLGAKRSFNVAVAFGIAGHRIASELAARSSIGASRSDGSR